MKDLLTWLNINPKVITGAVSAAVIGGLTTALATNGDTGKALLVAFASGAGSGVLAYLKSQGDWAPKP